MATLTPEQIQQFASERLGLQGQAEQTRRRIQEDFDFESRLLGEQSDRDQVQVADQMGSQGLFNSGIRINEQGQVERRENEQRSQMNLGRSRSLEDVGYGLTRSLAGVDARERESLAEAARLEREEAIQRALLEAQARQPVVQPPAYPNPVIPYYPPPPNPYAAFPGGVPPAPQDPFAAYMQKIKTDAQQGYLIGRQAPSSSGSTPLKFNPATGAPYLTPLSGRF